MVESMLALARADATQDSAVRLDVTALACERADTWNRLATERGLSLLVDAKGPALARAGPARVTQVLDNLLSNALRHAPPGTEVTVSTAADAQWVSLHVRDRGPGLSEEQRARAFDRFWRGSTGARRLRVRARAGDRAQAGRGRRRHGGARHPSGRRHRGGCTVAA